MSRGWHTLTACGVAAGGEGGGVVRAAARVAGGVDGEARVHVFVVAF